MAVDANIFDAIGVNTVVGAIAPFEHTFQLAFDVTIFFVKKQLLCNY